MKSKDIELEKKILCEETRIKDFIVSKRIEIINSIKSAFLGAMSAEKIAEKIDNIIVECIIFK